MRIELKKLTNATHELRCIRHDGSVDVVELETRSLLVHDFTHLAFELEAGLQGGFWGAVASGRTIESLLETFTYPTDDLKMTELYIGPLQGVMQDKVSPAQYLDALQNLFTAQNLEIPDWLTDELIDRTKERFRKLMGEWNALPFGEVMTVTWELPKNAGGVS